MEIDVESVERSCRLVGAAGIDDDLEIQIVVLAHHQDGCMDMSGVVLASDAKQVAAMWNRPTFWFKRLLHWTGMVMLVQEYAEMALLHMLI
ncbi:hypothetical protein [Xanthomonas sp. 3058]|uniref:hypothetical protein n=1 Tax=Xanthomonas sp. 3058 TaxID=3035314 RepID=UPI00161C16D3|nr:hypothetical protein [Xanthomonas sp. 3058]MBB5865796.1 hypothetical protein [Xanthomonas sp. 3058]